ncbi:MAG TPA: GntR family transcriptional regulator [Rhodothermales bacterium]|nr:GntR family transcriptional regulator [Rhodothermales bacterium]
MAQHELKSGRTRHEQVSEWLRSQIERGAYRPDDRLPSENELGERFGTSRITIRRALQTLENEGLIYRRQGLGSFVQKPRLRHGLVRLTDFAQDMERAGLEASSRILFHAPVKAEASIALVLDIEVGTTVVRLDRVRLGDGEPVALDRTWLPAFYAQLLEGRDLTHETIYHVLERDYNIPVLRGRYRIEAVNADAEVASALKVPRGRALLLLERTSMTVGDRQVYYQRRYYRNDRAAFELEVERSSDGASSRPDGLPLRDFEPVIKRAV